MEGYETQTRDDGGSSGSSAAVLGVAFGAVAIGALAVDPTVRRGGRGFAVITRAVRFTSFGIENWPSRSQHRILPCPDSIGRPPSDSRVALKMPKTYGDVEKQHSKE